MKKNLLKAVSAAVLVSLSAPAVTASSPTAASAYNFQYRSSGESRILPLQVFDDGKETYFQFSERAAVLPAILIDTPEGPVVSKYHRSGPYVVIQGVAATYRLQFGSLAGAVQYAGPARQVTAGAARAETPAQGAVANASAEPVSALAPALAPAAAPKLTPVVAHSTTQPAAAIVPAYGPVSPLPSALAAGRVDARQTDARVEFFSGKSVLSTEAQAELKKALAGDGEITKVIITGRDDADYKEGLARARALAIRAAVLKLGVRADRVTLREGFMVESDDAQRPASDISVVRAAPQSMRVVDGAMPATVTDAIALIARGMHGLVRLKVMEEPRAVEIVAAIKRLVNVKDGGAGVPGKGATIEARAPEETWSLLPSDGTAQRGLRKWVERAGMTLEWQADVDYPISSPIVVKGSARTAMNAVRDALAMAKKPLTIEFEANRVIVRNQRS